MGQIHTRERFQKQEFAERSAPNMHLMLPSHEKLMGFSPITSVIVAIKATELQNFRNEAMVKCLC